MTPVKMVDGYKNISLVEDHTIWSSLSHSTGDKP